MFATFIGGPFAAAYLVRANFVGLKREVDARRHALALAVCGAVALYLTIDAPPDPISRSILSIPFSLLSVGLYLVVFNRPVLTGAVQRKRSVWWGVLAGVLARIAILGVIDLEASLSA